MRTSRLTFVLIVHFVYLSCQSHDPALELHSAQNSLLEVSMQADSVGMVTARQRFVRLLQDRGFTQNDSLSAAAHYWIAFANWQLAFATYSNQEGAKQIIKDALAHLDTTTAKRPDLIEAYAVMRRCQYWRYVLDPSAARVVWTESQAILQKARALAPQHPLVMLEEAIDLFYKPLQAGGDQQQGLARFQSALNILEHWRQEDPAQHKWWLATAYMSLGQAYLMLAQPEAAEQSFLAALALQPDYAYVQTAMLPMTQLLAPPPLRSFAGIPWSPLARDAENDGRNPQGAEVKALSFYYDQATDTLWFKLDLARPPDPHAFGINLVMDTDQNQGTGVNWWGRNHAFKYDKLVSVWVIKAANGAYRGTVGIADAKGAQLGRYTDLFQNNLAFQVDTSSQAMILGCRSTELDEDGSFDLLAAVGSNAAWNDDIPDSSAVTIRLHR